MSAIVDLNAYTTTRIEPTRHSKPTLEKFKVQNANELLARKFAPRELVLDPWIPAKGLTMLTAERGVGKTWCSLSIAYAVATGGAFMRWKAPKARRVLFIDGEMEASELQERMKSIIENQPPGSPALKAANLGWIIGDDEENGAPDLGNPDHQALLTERAKEYDLIIVDNLATLVRTGDENERKGWLPVQDWALRQKREGKAVLFIHHAGKNGGQRGSSGREDTLASSVLLRRPMDYVASEGARFEVIFTKSRGFYGDDAAPFEAHLQDGVWHTKDLSESVGGLSDGQSSVLEALSDGQPKALMQLRVATGIDQGPLDNLLNRMVKRGQVTRQGRGIYVLPTDQSVILSRDSLEGDGLTEANETSGSVSL